MIKKSRLSFLNNGYNRVEFVKSHVCDLPVGTKLLDAGAGECQFKQYYDHCEHTTQDFVQNKFSTIDTVCDIASLPYENESFDVVLCTEVLEHVFNPNDAIKELMRVLKKGGKLILTVPVCSLPHMEPHYYYNGFSEFWLKRVFKDQCSVISIKKNGNRNDWIDQELWNSGCMINKMYALFDILTYDESKSQLCFGYHVVVKKK